MISLTRALCAPFLIACGNSPGAPGDVVVDSGASGEAGNGNSPRGGYQLGDSVDADVDTDGDGVPDGSSGSGTTECDPDAITLKAIVRDFLGGDQEAGHPDFETFGGSTVTAGLVKPELGENGKPVYTGLCSEPGMTEICPNAQQMTTEEAFAQWYVNTPDVNQAFEVFLSLETDAGTISFESGEFFPVDGVGFGNEGREHNFHFTTEVHTQFKYVGGEVFTFVGDDDVWIFVNGQLAVDLGGLHGEVTGVVDLDSVAADLGLTPGETYTFDLFHAERHTENSRFRIDTNLQFTECGELVPGGLEP